MHRFLLLLILGHALVATAQSPLPREILLPGALATAEGVWRGAQQKPPRASSRDLFSAALTWCEAGTSGARLAPMFTVAAAMQDRDTNSKTYGNFLWSTAQTNLLDKNAVDFCMQSAAVLWLKHRDTMPAEARALLTELLRHGVEGQKKHRVNDDYTNIALMAAVNLILLGEAMDRPDAFAEGCARLNAFIAATRRNGTHEYVSPTYYGVDLDDLVLLEAHVRDAGVRTKAQALLHLFWTDIAANWYPPAQKLAGPRSRDYDYVRGLGILDHHLVANGWLPVESTNPVPSIFPAFTRWNPPAELLRFSETNFPRLVEQSWGPATNQFRVNYLLHDVVLGTAGAGYGGRMDLPLCVDFPGARREARGYFIPDGRHDPYGVVKIMERSGHQKTLHLQPYWAATQRRVDAIGLAVYRTNDLTPETTSLESHFVLPIQNDGLWIDDRRIENGPPQTLAAGATLFLRKGTAAVGIKVPLALDAAGKTVQPKVVFDPGFQAAFRLTLEHGTRRMLGEFPMAAFWVRIGSDLQDDAAFAAWRRRFQEAAAVVDVQPGGVRIQVTGEGGPLSIHATPPFKVPAEVEPAGRRVLLSVNGIDLGQALLDTARP